MAMTLDKAMVPTLSRYSARERYREYAEVEKVSHDPVHRELANVYKHLSMGHKVISATKAMEIAGVHPDGLPVLALGHATAKWVWYVFDAGRINDPDLAWNNSACAFVSDYAINPGWQTGRSPMRALRHSVFRFIRPAVRPLADKARAMVPIVPPKVLRTIRGDLANYQILWEADWKVAPKDPLLLRRISRDMYVVLAQWDLTEIERFVMERAAFAGE